MAFDLADGGGYRAGMAVPVVVDHSLRVLVVDADRMSAIGKFLDDSAVLRAPGLDFIEVIRLADRPEIRGLPVYQEYNVKLLSDGKFPMSIPTFQVNLHAPTRERTTNK